MVKFACEPFSNGELVRISFDRLGTDEAWEIAINEYLANPRLAHQFFLIDNTRSMGTASAEGIRKILVALDRAGVTALRVAQVSENAGFNMIARLTEEIGYMENLETTSDVFGNFEDAETWLADLPEGHTI